LGGGEDVKIFCVRRTFKNILEGVKYFGTDFYVFTFWKGEFPEAPPWLAPSGKILKL
jgi:hypothetical protein